jgi:hypothetical protein
MICFSNKSEDEKEVEPHFSSESGRVVQGRGKTGLNTFSEQPSAKGGRVRTL